MSKNPVAVVVLGWLLPGAGHWALGQRVKAVVFCFLIIAVFALGALLTDGGCLSVGRHPYAAILQAATGVPAGVGLLLSAKAVEPPASRMSDFGMLLTLVAGALNVLLMADALYRTESADTREKELD